MQGWGYRVGEQRFFSKITATLELSELLCVVELDMQDPTVLHPTFFILNSLSKIIYTLQYVQGFVAFPRLTIRNAYLLSHKTVVTGFVAESACLNLLGLRDDESRRCIDCYFGSTSE